MKKILFLLLVFFIPIVIQSQTISENPICKFDNLTDLDVYSLKYNEKSGTYVYVLYDSTKISKNSIISNKGNSGDYDYINNYLTLFDSEGNYYLVVYISMSDTISKNAFLKNGKEIFTYDYISSELIESNGKIYMMCTEKEKSFIASFDISNGTFSNGKIYDEIILCDFEKNVYEGEPIGKIGFTKDGKPYYIAKSNYKTFLVIGDEEQKYYADIDAYTVTLDKSGKFAYVAKDTGSFMYQGGNFVVFGDKKYKTAYGIYNLIVDEKGNVIYIASDSSSDYYPQRVMIGDKAISKTYNGGIYNINITPEGKIYYIANEEKKNSKEYESFFVFDGKEHKSYMSVINPKVYPGNKFVYVAQLSEDRYAVVSGTDEYKIGKKLYLQTADLLNDGTLSYISTEYGDYDKKINDKFYAYIGDKKFGPYDGMMMLDYGKNSFIVSDKKGNYAYLVNNIKDFTDYYYVLYTNSGKSEVFDNISDVHLYNGKALYIASHLVDKDKYIYKYRAYYDNKPLTPLYDSYSEFNFDEKTGVATFYISKGNEFYKVEVKL
jgi:hypothetical protein